MVYMVVVGTSIMDEWRNSEVINHKNVSVDDIIMTSMTSLMMIHL